MSESVAALLEEDHSSLGALFDELDAELSNRNLLRAFELLDLFWARLAVHIRAEHLHLFPAVSNFGKANEAITTLRADHDFFMKELASMIKEMREINAGAPEEFTGAEEFRRRLMIVKERLDVHNRLEEEEVYTLPLTLLDGRSLFDLGDSVQRELSNLPPRLVAKANQK